MPKVYLNVKEQDRAKLERRMDRFDSVVTEYLRKNKYTINDLAFQVQINPSSLWRWRTKPQYFYVAPFGIITKILQIAGCSSESLRYICGHDK